MIKPTVGRVVWVRNRNSFDTIAQPEAGLIAYVWSDTHINVGGFDRDGKPFAETSLYLWQGEGAPPAYRYAEWMPYQKGQAAKADAAASAPA